MHKKEINVRLHEYLASRASLESPAGKPARVLLLEKEVTVNHLLCRLGLPEKEIGLVMVNGKQAAPGTTLVHGDEVELFPPIGGG